MMQLLLFDIDEGKDYWLPKEFLGREVKSGDKRKGKSREWTPQEEYWVVYLMSEGLSMIDIAKYTYREPVSVSLKLKRLAKKDKSYNDAHKEDKYLANDEFFKSDSFSSVLDLFAGEKSFWRKYPVEVVSNDLNHKGNDYSDDALKILCYLYYTNQKFDLIDLDPFGSAYDCFDLAIKMAKKGVIITFGEIGHQRWKRTDFVSRYYGITTFEEFTMQRLIDEVVKIGRKNKKELIPIIIKEYKNIGRVYFKIDKYKVEV